MNSPERILLVQPDNTLRSEIAAALKQAGHFVAEASNGEEALALASSFAPEAAVVGSNIPDVQRVNLITRLKDVCPEVARLILGTSPEDIRELIDGATGHEPAPLWERSGEEQLEALLRASETLNDTVHVKPAANAALKLAVELCMAQRAVLALAQDNTLRALTSHAFGDEEEALGWCREALENRRVPKDSPLVDGRKLFFSVAISLSASVFVVIEGRKITARCAESPSVVRLGNIISSSLKRAFRHQKLHERLNRKVTELGRLQDTQKAVTDASGHWESAQLMLTNIRDLTGAADCMLFAVRDECMQVVAHTVEGLALPLGVNLHRNDTIAWQVLETGIPLFVRDVRQDGEKLDRLAAHKVDFASALYVPLVYRGSKLGVLGVGFCETREADLPADFIHSLDALAAQAALILDGMRLLEESQGRISELNMLIELAGAASSTLDPEKLAEEALQSIQSWTNASRLAIYFCDQKQQNLDLLAYRNIPEEVAKRIQRIEEVEWEMVTSIASVTLDDMAVVDTANDQVPGWIADALSDLEIRDLAVLPLWHRGEFEGCMCLGYREKLDFSSADAHLLSAAANQLAAALANARLYRQVDSERRKLESLFSAMTDCVVVYDRTGSILTLNRSAREFIGAGSDTELSGALADHLQRGQLFTVDGAPVKNGQTPEQRALLGETVSAGEYMFESEGGSQRYFNISAAPIRDDCGEVTAGVAVFRDITTKILANQRIREMAQEAKERAELIEAQSQRLEAMFDAIPGIVAIFDKKGKILMTNRTGEELIRREVGNKLEQVYASDWFKMYRPDGTSYPVDDHPAIKVLQKGQVIEGEQMLVRLPSGSELTLLMNLAPVQGFDGSAVGAVIVAQDISSLRESFLELEHDRNRNRNVAERLQTAFLPNELPEIEGFEVAKKYVVALAVELVGGDFYDIFSLTDGRMGVVIGDVSGKGLSAAVYTAMTKYMLRAYAMEDPCLESVIAKLNDALCAWMPIDYFVTLFFGVIEPESGRFTYVNAGHEQPLLLEKSAGSSVPLDVTGRALGLLPDAVFKSKTIRLLPEDVLLMYTDGVTDYRTQFGRLGIEGLAEHLDGVAGLKAERIVEELWSALSRDGKEQMRDDVAILCIKAV